VCNDGCKDTETSQARKELFGTEAASSSLEGPGLRTVASQQLGPEGEVQRARAALRKKKERTTSRPVGGKSHREEEAA